MIIAQCINDHSSSKKALECRKEIDFSIPVTGFLVHSNANMEMLLITDQGPSSHFQIKKKKIQCLMFSKAEERPDPEKTHCGHE